MSACGIFGGTGSGSGSGESYARTDRVDVFLSADEIPREHRKIGETELAIAADQTLGQTQHLAQREARRRGAHAVIIRDQALANPWRGSALTAPRTVSAHFYRYGSEQPDTSEIVEPKIDPATTQMPDSSVAEAGEGTREIKPRWQWWWNRGKTDDTVVSEAEPPPPEPEAEGKRIDTTRNAVFTGDVDKLEELGLPKPDQTVLEE